MFCFPMSPLAAAQSQEGVLGRWDLAALKDRHAGSDRRGQRD
jgi:hypothetical protein